MDYTEFVIRYTQEHPGMTERELREAIPVAWERYQNQPAGDTYAQWMGDAQMQLDIKRALGHLP